MPLYPSAPRPSSVSAPEIIDPALVAQTDQGYAIRRVRWSRPRRRWTLSYLALPTGDLRFLRNFLYGVRLGALDFDWIHPTAIDYGTFQPTTPVRVLLTHGLYSGQWVVVTNTPNPGINGNFFSITTESVNSFFLNGTTAAGIEGVGNVQVYVPHATAVMQEEGWPSPATLIGPEQVGYTPAPSRTGYYSATVTLEEQF
jgi:hypothetical protein